MHLCFSIIQIFYFLFDSIIIEIYSLLGMQDHQKSSYVPTPFTLATHQKFGELKRPKKLNNTHGSQHCKSEAKMPRFTLSKKAFDKQNLLHQLRHQQQRKDQIHIQNRQLKSRFAQTRNKLIIQYKQTDHLSFNSINTIKRQIEAMIIEISGQRQQIEGIKRSKKYNQYMELVNIKEVYQEQINSLKGKVSHYKYYEREEKKIIRQEVQRKQKLTHIHKNMQAKITSEIDHLRESLREKNQIIRRHLDKEMQLKRKKEKLIRDIFHLQDKTGKIYIEEQPEKDGGAQKQVEMNRQSSNCKESWQQQTKDTKKCNMMIDEDEEYESQQNVEEERQSSVNKEEGSYSKPKKMNLSF